MKHFIGIDLGDKTNEVCILNNQGQTVDTFKIENNADAFTLLFKKYPKASYAIEVGSHALWIHDLAIACGVQMYVANPRKTNLIGSSKSKNDKVDAALLAKLLKSDPDLLFPVTLRDIKTQKDFCLVKSRDSLVSARGDLIRHIRGIIKPFGIILPDSVTVDNFHETITEHVSAKDFPAIPWLVESIKVMSKNIKVMDKQLNKLINTKYPEAINLQTIPGVGPITAISFLLIIGNPKRFNKSRIVGSYLGLVPKQNQSGSMDKSLGITKTGNPLLRRLLVNCAHRTLGVFGKDSQLRRFGEKIMGDTNNKIRKKKAVVAVSRKMAVLMHSMLISGHEFKNTVESKRKSKKK